MQMWTVERDANLLTIIRIWHTISRDHHTFSKGQPGLHLAWSKPGRQLLNTLAAYKLITAGGTHVDANVDPRNFNFLR